MEQEAPDLLWQPCLQSNLSVVGCSESSEIRWSTCRNEGPPVCLEGGDGVSTRIGEDSVARQDRQTSPETQRGQLVCCGDSESSVEDALSTRSNTAGSLFFISGREDELCQEQSSSCRPIGKGMRSDGDETSVCRVKQECMHETTRDDSYCQSNADIQTDPEDSEGGPAWRSPTIEQRDVGDPSEKRGYGEVGGRRGGEWRAQARPVSASCGQSSPENHPSYSVGCHFNPIETPAGLCSLSSEGKSEQVDTARSGQFSGFTSESALNTSSVAQAAVLRSPVGLEHYTSDNFDAATSGSAVQRETSCLKQQRSQEPVLVCPEPALPLSRPRGVCTESPVSSFPYAVGASVTGPLSATAEPERRWWNGGRQVPSAVREHSFDDSGGRFFSTPLSQDSDQQSPFSSVVSVSSAAVGSLGLPQSGGGCAFTSEDRHQSSSRCFPAALQVPVEEGRRVYRQDTRVLRTEGESPGVQSPSIAYGSTDACISPRGVDYGRNDTYGQPNHGKPSTASCGREDEGQERFDADNVTPAGNSVPSRQTTRNEYEENAQGEDHSWRPDAITRCRAAPVVSSAGHVVSSVRPSSNICVPQRCAFGAEGEGYNAESGPGGQLRYVLLFPDEEAPLQSSQVSERAYQVTPYFATPSPSFVRPEVGFNGDEQPQEGEERMDGIHSAESLNTLTSTSQAGRSEIAFSNGLENPGGCLFPARTTAAGGGNLMRRSSHQSTSASEEVNGSGVPSVDGRDGGEMNSSGAGVSFRDYGGERSELLCQYNQRRDQDCPTKYSQKTSTEGSSDGSWWQCYDAGDTQEKELHQEQWITSPGRQEQRHSAKRKRPHTQYQKSVGPVWSAGEDEKLAELVNKQGFRWASISAELSRLFGVVRTGKQCRERWCNHVNPNVKRGDWSPDEDSLILELQGRIGNRWATIAKQLPGRTENAVKNRFISLRNVRMSGRSKRDAPAVCSSQSSSTPEAGGGSPLRRVSGARVVHEGADGQRDENLLQAEKAVCQTVVTHGASLTPDRQPSGDFDKSLPASPSRSASLSGGARPVEGADAGLALPPVGEFHDVATAAGHMWAGSNGGADCCKREHPDGSSERPISHHPGPPDFEVSASETEVKRFPSQVCPRDPVSRSQILDCSGERTPRIKREREWLFGATGDARRGEGGGRAPGTGSSEPDPKRGRVSGEEYEDTKRSGEVGRVFSESQAASFSTVPRTDSPEDLGSPSAPHQCSFSTQKRALTQAGPRDAMPCTHPCSQVTHGLREDNSAVGHSLHQACHQRCSQDAGVSGETREMSPVLRVPQLSGRGCIPGPAPNVLCLENQGETHQRYGAAILATTTAEPVSACPQANAEAMFPRGDKSPESPSTVRNHSQLLCSGRGRADSSPAIVTNGLRCRGSQPSAQLCLEGNVDSSGNAREATGEVSRRLLRGCETQRSCADLGDLLQLSPTSQAQNETGAHVRPAKASGPHHLLQECPRGVRDEGSRASGHPGDELTDAASLLRIKDEGACRGVSSTESQAIQPDWNRMTRGDANGRCGEVGRDHPYWANEAHERATGGTTVATNDRGSQTSHSLASRGQHCGRELFRKQPLHISQSPASLDSHGSDSPAKCDLVQTRGARHLEPRAAAVVHEIRANAGLTSWTGQSPVCSPRHSEIATHGGRGLFPEEVPLRRSSSAEVGTPANAEARSVTPVASCAALQRTRSLEQSPFKCSVSLSVAPESLSGVREAEAHNPWTKSEWPGFDVSRTDGDGPGRPTEEVPVRVPDQDAPHRAEGGGGHGCTRACDEQAGSMEFKTSLGPMCASHRHALQMHQPSRISRFLASETPGVPSPTTPASASLTEPVVGPPAAVPSVHVPSLNVKEELQTASDLHCGTPYDSSEYAVTKNSSSIQSESEQRGAPEWTADLIVGGRGPVHVLETPDSPEVQIPYPHDHVLGRFPTGGGSGDGERFSQVDVCSSSDSQRGSYCLSSAAAEHRESVAGSDTICYRPPTDRHGLAYVSGAHGCPATEKLTATGGATLDSALRLPSLIDNPNGSSSRASQQCTTLKGTEVPVWCPSQPGGTALTLPLDTGTRLGSTVYARGDSGQRREASDLNLCEERDNLRLDQQRSHPDKPLPPLHNQAQRVNPPLDVQRVCPSDDLESGNGETGTESRDCFTQASLALSAAAVECRRSSEIITDSGLVARTGRPDCESLYMQSGSAVSASCSRSESSRPEQEQQLGGLEASRAQGESAARSGLSLAQPSFVHPEQAFRQKAPVYHCFNAQMKETKPTDSLARSGSSSIQGRSLFWALSSHVLAQGEAFPSASVRCLLPCFSVTGFESLGSAFQLLLVDEDSHSQRKWGKQETFNLQGAIRDEVGCKVDKNDYNIPSPDVQCKRCHHADSGAL